jgi:hypothetical protein
VLSTAFISEDVSVRCAGCSWTPVFLIFEVTQKNFEIKTVINMSVAIQQVLKRIHSLSCGHQYTASLCSTQEAVESDS